MTGSDDDEGVTPRREPLDDRAADALLSGHSVVGEELLSSFVAQMRALEPTSPPRPSAELAALLEAGVPAAAAPISRPLAGRRRRTRAVSWGLPLQTALGGLAFTGLVLGAASTNSLPSPVQTAVADVVEAVTPLTVPRPTPHAAKPSTPAATPSPTPQERVVPTRSARPGATEDRDEQPQESQDGRRDGETQERPDASPRPSPADRGERSDDSDDSETGRTPQPRVTRTPKSEPTPSEASQDDRGSGHRSGSNRHSPSLRPTASDTSD